MGTIHLALGNNMSMGGTVDVPLHLDGLILRPQWRSMGECSCRKGRSN